MLPLISLNELRSCFNAATQKLQALALIQKIIPSIIEKSGIRNPEQIFDFIIESSYEMLPYPIRILIKKEVYVEVAKENKELVIKYVISHLK